MLQIRGRNFDHFTFPTGWTDLEVSELQIRGRNFDHFTLLVISLIALEFESFKSAVGISIISPAKFCQGIDHVHLLKMTVVINNSPH